MWKRTGRTQEDRAIARKAPTWSVSEYAIAGCIGLLAAVLLFWGLAGKYLWQDEAETAVLAERLLQFGRPLAYDGRNLITADDFGAEDTASIGQRTTSPKAAIDYCVRRGDMKPDTTWKWHPWGQFVVTAVSLKLLGQNTLAARFPFALAGLLTVLLLYRWVRESFGSPLIAQLAAAALVLNPYWILHDRQCRYYALSSLFLVLTFVAYARWQQGARWGPVVFVLAAWGWFQMDYGAVWPVLVVLFMDAFLADRHEVWRPIAVGAALAASIAPFAYYYELWARHGTQLGTWLGRLKLNLFNANEYVVPAAVVFAAMALLAWRRKLLPPFERRLVAISCGIIVAFWIWIPSVAAYSFLRYIVIAVPVGCVVGAWLMVRLAGKYASVAYLGAAIWLITPWLSLPPRIFFSPHSRHQNGAVVRPALFTGTAEVFGHRDDPNREVIEWLRKNAKPTDEILINYEDIPLMFYLPNPIRGGIPAFRAEDDANTPPNFAILRRSVDFYHVPVFAREVQRYRWSRVPVQIPDRPWGNNPDPIAVNRPSSTASILIARRVAQQ